MWAIATTIAFGLWVTASPAMLGIVRPAAVSAWVVGPIVASFATIAMWDATRSVRWWNLPLAVWLLFAPTFVEHQPAAAASSILCGAGIAGLAVVPVAPRHRFGGGWSGLWGTHTRRERTTHA